MVICSFEHLGSILERSRTRGLWGQSGGSRLGGSADLGDGLAVFELLLNSFDDTEDAATGTLGGTQHVGGGGASWTRWPWLFLGGNRTNA